MPTYLYNCAAKHGEFEEEHSIRIKLQFCPKCKEEGVENKIERLIALPGKGVVELSGHELLAKIKSDAKDLQKRASKDEKIFSNLLGETRYNQLQTQIDRNKK